MFRSLVLVRPPQSGKLSKLSHPSQTICCLSRKEVVACYRLFHRSGIFDQSSKWRRFWVNSSSGIQNVSVSGFHTTVKRYSDDKKSNEDDKNNRDQFFALMKSIVTFSLLSLAFATLFGPRQRPQLDPETAKIIQQGGARAQPNSQFQTSPSPQINPQDVTWHDFYYNMLLAGEVQSITVFPSVNVAAVTMRPGAMFKGQRVDGYVYRLMLKGGSSEFEDTIRSAESKLGIPPEEGVNIIYQRQPENLNKVINVILVIGVLALLFKVGSQFRSSIMSSNPFAKLGKADFTLIDPQIRAGKGVKFSDVAGMKEAKIEVREFVDYLKNPSRYKELGAKPPKGALLTGPPGCGKTMLAKAVANESNVPFLSMNGSEFIEMIGGLGAARVRNLFLEARNRSPSIIYIDEIDAIGRKRSGSANSGGVGEAEQTLNQLLVEMDGIASKEGVIMLASTNRADVLDKALLRPGRFDRHILIDLPTVIERKEILDHHMKSVLLSKDAEKYSERLSTLTPGFSGADLANVVNEAALHAARIKNDKVKPDNFEYAIERVIAGPEKRTNVLSPNEKKVVAYHESGHALVGWMMEHTDALLKVTILPRTSQALGFAQYTPTDKKLYSPEELQDRMCMALGGRVAESLTFNKVTTGAQNDLEKVTQLAYSQIKYYGFNEKVGLFSFENDTSSGVRPYSKKLQATMDHEARLLISSAYKRTEELLIKHKDLLRTMAEALLDKETLNYNDVVKLLGPPPYGKKNLVTPVDFENSLKSPTSE